MKCITNGLGNPNLKEACGKTEHRDEWAKYFAILTITIDNKKIFVYPKYPIMLCPQARFENRSKSLCQHERNQD
jgi:hypothetical protein